MSEELKPCPFCGGQADRHRTPGGNSVITCHNCGSVVRLVGRYKEITETWNNRPTEKAAREEVLKLVEDLLKERLTALRAGPQSDESPVSKMIPYNQDYVDGRKYEIKRQIEAVDEAYQERFNEQG